MQYWIETIRINHSEKIIFFKNYVSKRYDFFCFKFYIGKYIKKKHFWIILYKSKTILQHLYIFNISAISEKIHIEIMFEYFLGFYFFCDVPHISALSMYHYQESVSCPSVFWRGHISVSCRQLHVNSIIKYLFTLIVFGIFSMIVYSNK